MQQWYGYEIFQGVQTYFKKLENESAHGKTNKMACASTQSDQSLHCWHEETLGLVYPFSAQRRFWSDWVDAGSFCSFCHTQVCVCVCVYLGLTSFQQFFSHITTVSGCDRELNAHFYSAASLKYHVPDTWHDTTPSHIILKLGRQS